MKQAVLNIFDLGRRTERFLNLLPPEGPDDGHHQEDETHAREN